MDYSQCLGVKLNRWFDIIICLIKKISVIRQNLPKAMALRYEMDNMKLLVNNAKSHAVKFSEADDLENLLLTSLHKFQIFIWCIIQYWYNLYDLDFFLNLLPASM